MTAQAPSAPLLAAARAIAADLRPRAFAADSLRRIPPETVDELARGGLLRARQPARFGGLDVPVSVFREVIYDLAASCASTAWVLNVLGAGSSMLAASFPEDAQSDVWGGDPEALLCNVLFPGGSASAVRGGYRLSGRFPYASGCDLAQWALLGSRISGREIPPHAISWGMLVPMSELAVIDDWDVLGLAGTGSKTLVANDVFVPNAHVAPIENPTGTTGPYAFSTIAAGIARGAVVRFVAYVDERGSIGGGWSAASEAMQAKVSESAAEADAAWALILRDCAAGSEPLTPVLRARNQRNAAYAMRLAHAAVERLFLTCGGSAAYRSSLIQQSFRDVHTAALHFSAHWDSAAIASGRVLLELGGDVVF